MDRYKRIDEVVEIEMVNEWLQNVTDGWKIINYKEVPAHKAKYIRLQVLLEKDETKTKKKRLFS